MLARRIMKLRKQNGMSQTDLAQKLNISASAEGMYEQGRRIPSLNILVAMSEIFDVSLDYLITGAEFEYRRKNEHKIQGKCPCTSCFWKHCY